MTNSVYTVLLVDDTWTDREQYRRYLRADTSRTYQFLEAASVAEGLEVYQSAKADLTSTGQIDAILLDYSLPDAYGLMFLEALQAQNDDHPPVIMATGSGDQRIAARAMKLGAADYLVKQDLTPGLLQRSISSAIDLARSRQKLQHYHGRLEMMHEQMEQIWENRKQSEAALQSGERKLRVIFDQASHLMGLLSLGGVLLEVNQAALDSVGVLSSEIIGKNFWETPWWHTEELQQQLRGAIATAAGGELIRYEVRFPNGCGSSSVTYYYGSTCVS